MKDKANNEKTSKVKGVWKKLIILGVIVVVMCFVMGKSFDITSDRVESMSQEEKEEMNDKWDKFLDWVNE